MDSNGGHAATQRLNQVSTLRQLQYVTCYMNAVLEQNCNCEPSPHFWIRTCEVTGSLPLRAVAMCGKGLVLVDGSLCFGTFCTYCSLSSEGWRRILSWEFGMSFHWLYVWVLGSWKEMNILLSTLKRLVRERSLSLLLFFVGCIFSTFKRLLFRFFFLFF